MRSQLADFSFVILHLLGQNPEWTTADVIREIEKRMGDVLTAEELEDLRTRVTADE